MAASRVERLRLTLARDAVDGIGGVVAVAVVGVSEELAEAFDPA